MSKLRKSGSKWPCKALTPSGARFLGSLAVLDELAVAAIADALLGSAIPEVAARPAGRG